MATNAIQKTDDADTTAFRIIASEKQLFADDPDREEGELGDGRVVDQDGRRRGPFGVGLFRLNHTVARGLRHRHGFKVDETATQTIVA